MSKYVTLKKSDFNEFIEKLAKINPVVAPVAKGKRTLHLLKLIMEKKSL